MFKDSFIPNTALGLFLEKHMNLTWWKKPNESPIFYE